MPAPIPLALPGAGAPGASGTSGTSGTSSSSGRGTAAAGASAFGSLVAVLLAAGDRRAPGAPTGPAGGGDPVDDTAGEERADPEETLDAAGAQAAGLTAGTAAGGLPTPPTPVTPAAATARQGAAGVLHGTVVHTLSRRGPGLGSTDEGGVGSPATSTGPADAEAATTTAASSPPATATTTTTATTTVPAPPTGDHLATGPTTTTPTAGRTDGDARVAGGAPNPAAPAVPAVAGPDAGPGAGEAAPTTGAGAPSSGEAAPAPSGAPSAPPPGAPTVQAQTVVTPPAQLGAPVSLTPTQSRVLVADQVAPAVTRLVEAGPGTHRLVLRLDPEELGPVRVTLTLHQGTVSVRLAAGSAQARAALADGSLELHRLLGAHAGETRVSVHDLAAPGLAHVAEPRSLDASGSGPGDGTREGGKDGSRDGSRDGARSDAEQDGAAPRDADPTTSGQGRSGARSGEQERHAGTRAGSIARDGTTVTATRPGPSDPLSSGRARLDLSM